MASLEKGHAAYATSSGMAGIALICQTLGHGGHCLAIRGIYPGSSRRSVHFALASFRH
jgi:O-acetylhomoserine/O-acetylserine sulfhydrylase-like pyridoxal-dependent enzyme